MSTASIAATAIFLTRVENLQKEAVEWTREVFGDGILKSRPEMALRTLEELTEACQSVGLTREMAHKVIDQVFDKPTNPDVGEELGGTILTLMRFAQVVNVNLGEAILAEFADVNRPERKAEIRAKWEKKIARVYREE